MTKGERPHVLIIGGFLTEPVQYAPLQRRLLARGAASVSIAPVHVIDWVACGLAGLGPLLVRAGLAIRRVHRRGGHRPILVVAHSGGGILARLAMAPEPLDGRRAAVSDAVGGLVTLGTPHGLAGAPVGRRHRGVAAAAFLDRVAPGAWGVPETTFLTVASTAIPPMAPDGASRRARLQNAPFRLAVGPVGPSGGDGIVGVDLAHLPGARQLTFDDVVHGVVGPCWYGDDPIVDRWWPVALEDWRDALAARAASGRAGAPPGAHDGRPSDRFSGPPAGATGPPAHRGQPGWPSP